VARFSAPFRTSDYKPARQASRLRLRSKALVRRTLTPGFALLSATLPRKVEDALARSADQAPDRW
jgi:hypothetical protein